MRSVNTNEQIKIYYHPDQLKKGEVVLFDSWDDLGTLLFSGAATQEIPDEGVYYLDYLTPSYNCYILIKASLSDGSESKSFVLKVGSPPINKAFYSSNQFETGQTILYDIFDEDGTSVKNGTLTEVAGGFYFADVSSLTGVWFFEVDPLAVKD